MRQMISVSVPYHCTISQYSNSLSPDIQVETRTVMSPLLSQRELLPGFLLGLGIPHVGRNVKAVL